MSNLKYVGVFGYGSLVSPCELRKYSKDGRPSPIISMLLNYQRDWEVATIDGTCFLGVQPRKGFDVNGVVIYVDRWELESLDRREALYHRQRVDGLVVHGTNSNPRFSSPIEGPIYTYVPGIFERERAKEFIARDDDMNGAVIIKHYDKLVKDAFKSISREFYNQYIQTTIRDPRIRML